MIKQTLRYRINSSCKLFLFSFDVPFQYIDSAFLIASSVIGRPKQTAKAKEKGNYVTFLTLYIDTARVCIAIEHASLPALVTVGSSQFAG